MLSQTSPSTPAAIAAEILNFGSFATLLIGLIWRFTRHYSYRRIIFEAWLGLLFWAVLNCVFFPLLFFKLGCENAFNYFPEMPGIAAVGFLGWVFGLELVAAIFLVRQTWTFAVRLVRRFKNRT